MHPEIEARFLNVDHDAVRQKLTELGDKLEKPLRLMRRTIFDCPDRHIENVAKGRLRVRDEGDRITITYKSPRTDQYYDETETTVGSYDTMVRLLEVIGLEAYSTQESRRETWRYGNVEVVLDEWPWVKPYIEIEGEQEEDVQDCAAQLGFDWKAAVFGAVESAYRAEYPGIMENEGIGEIAEIKFGASLPAWLQERKLK